MASIEKRAGAWRVRWIEGGVHRARKCPTRKAAEELKREIETAHALGREWEPASARALPDLRLTAADYVRSCALRHAASTVVHAAGRLEIWLDWLQSTDPRRASWTLDVLTVGMLERYYAHLVTEKAGRHNRPRDPNTAYKYVNAVELFWAWAADRDEYAQLVPRARRFTSQIARVEARDVVAPTWSQMAACVAELDGWQRSLGVLLYYTGLRVQQVMGLRWSDLDAVECSLHVRGELGKSAAERSGRVIPISRHLLDELLTWPRPDAWIVSTGPLQCARERAARGEHFGDAWARTGAPENVWVKRPHHTFRSGVQTGLAAAGAKWEAVEILLGHALPGSGNLYLHRHRMPLREAVDLIPRLEIPPHRARGWSTPAGPSAVAGTPLQRRARGIVGSMTLRELELMVERAPGAWDRFDALRDEAGGEWLGVHQVLLGAVERRLLKLRRKARRGGAA